MEPKKSSTLLNLSNQVNLMKANHVHLSQYNFFAIMGGEYLNTGSDEPFKIPLSIYINKSGELTVNGFDKEALDSKEKIKIYADKKITCK